MPLDRQSLDHLMTHGCQREGCTEAHDTEPLYFHGRCHMEAPAWISYKDGLLDINCSTCKNLIASIEVSLPSIPRETIHYSGQCHAKAPTWCFYQLGVLTIECAVCNNQIAKIEIPEKTIN